MKVQHPFTGGKKARNVTRRHRPLVWECMLGTVYARDPSDPSAEPVYFDYDWDAARKHARVEDCLDLRTAKCAFQYAGYPRLGKLALWGVYPRTKFYLNPAN